MAFDPRLSRWAQLDEHDLKAAEHAQAQRLKYEQHGNAEATPGSSVSVWQSLHRLTHGELNRIQATKDDSDAVSGNAATLRPYFLSDQPTDNDANLNPSKSKSSDLSIHHARSLPLTARVDEAASDPVKTLSSSLPAPDSSDSQRWNPHPDENAAIADSSSDSSLSDVPPDLSDEPPSTFERRSTAPSFSDSRSDPRTLQNAAPTSLQQFESTKSCADASVVTPAEYSAAISGSAAASADREVEALPPGSSWVISSMVRSSLGFWTRIPTTLSTTYQYYQPALMASFAMTRSFFATLQAPILGFLLVCVFPALLFLVFAAIARYVGTSITTALDGVGVRSCQMFMVGGICSFSCGSFPTAGVILFPRTCTPYTTKSSNIPATPYWEAEIDVNDIESIPQVLNLYRNRCSYYAEIIESLPPGCGVSEEEKKELLHRLSVLCTMLGGLHQTLPDVYRYVSTFMAVLLSHIDRTDISIERSLNGSSENALLEQQRILGDVPNFAAMLEQRYAGIEDGGNQTAREVQDAVKQAAALMAFVETLLRQNTEGKMDILRTWPLRKRLFHSLGWVRHEPVELRNSSIVSNALRHFFNGFVQDTHGILHTTSNNVTNLNTGLKNMAGKSYKSDVESFLGPDGMLQLRTWYGGYKVQAQYVQTTIGRPRNAKAKGINDESAPKAEDKTTGHGP
ncbi:MAG: hypothetical protein LQ337_004424 [Flavoplaca oasis]|nr:MAG: hypothetical protein LQ337_004424 [Flavoplaca oasis]